MRIGSEIKDIEEIVERIQQNQNHIQIIDASQSDGSINESLPEERILKPPKQTPPPERVSSPSSSISSKKTKIRAKRKSLADLDGRCFDIIAAYTGERLPSFIFGSRKICNEFLEYQIQINTEVLEAFIDGKDIIEHKIKSLKSGLFQIHESLNEEFIETIQHDYNSLVNILEQYQLNEKDLIVLKLFMNFLEVKFSEKHDHLFMR